MKKLKIFAGVALLIVILVFLWIRHINHEMTQITIEQVNISRIQDGEYSGEFSQGPITAQTLTHIQDARLQPLTLFTTIMDSEVGLNQL